jgi:recombination protein RecR
MREDIKYCASCHNISDSWCAKFVLIKAGTTRLFIVEDIRDVMAMKIQVNLRVYHHVWGKISPIDGVGPSPLNITTLVEK